MFSKQNKSTNVFNNWKKLSFLMTFLITLTAFMSMATSTPALAASPHCGDIVSDETWLNTDVHTIGVGCSNVVVATGVTLTISEGAIVKFDIGRSLIINGTLKVLGTSINNVSFTSYRDDTIGGDTNGDGGATVPAPGDWYQIQFGANSDDATSLIDHAILRYGGRTDTGPNPWVRYGSITLYSASPTIQNTLIQDSANYAYRADLNSFPTLTNNTLLNNGYNGLVLTTDGYGSTLNVDATWDITGTTYYIRDGITIGTDKTLTIAPDVIVKFNLGHSILVTGNNSALRVLGTESNPVILTSIRDDTVGGDTNNDGAATLPAPGDWYQIQFGANSDDATSLIDHAILRYGGRTDTGPNPWVRYGSITLYSASPTIQNTLIQDSANYGIYANLSTPNLSCNDIVHNGILNGGILYYGIFNATPTYVINAVNQWWGSISGPYHSSNPLGGGNAVTDGVDFTPWATNSCAIPSTVTWVYLPIIIK